MLHENRLYIVNDNDEDSYLLALDKISGREIWRIPRDEKSNWATPFVWQNELRTEIVTAGTDMVRSYDLAGKLLWQLKGMSTITIAMPYEHDGLLYVSSGYVGDRRQRPIYAIRPGAAGDISLESDQTSSPWIVWRQKMAAPYNPSTLIYQDRLWVLYDFGFLACFDAGKGATIFPRARIPQGRAFTASPWAYRDHVFCLNEDGVTFVFESGDKQVLSQSKPIGRGRYGHGDPGAGGQPPAAENIGASLLYPTTIVASRSALGSWRLP